MERTKPARKTTDTPLILTNDPSMTAWGWALVTFNGEVKKIGCIKTETEHKKRRIRKGDDTCRRISEINQQLLDLIYKNNVALIVSELPHGSQNAAAAVMIGVVTGVAQTIADTLSIPIEWYSEQDSKKNVLKKKSATKQEMIDEIDKRLNVPWFNIKYKDEAVADALAVYITARDQSSIIKYFKFNKIA